MWRGVWEGVCFLSQRVVCITQIQQKDTNASGIPINFCFISVKWPENGFFFGFIVEADTDSEGNELKVYEENDRKGFHGLSLMAAYCVNTVCTVSLA